MLQTTTRHVRVDRAKNAVRRCIPSKWNADTLGVATSSLCLVHCLALPAALLLMPGLSGSLLHDETTHYLLAFFVLTFCVSAIVPGFMKHGRLPVLALMMVGLSLVLFATFFAHPLLGESAEVPLITVGNLMVIASHLLNRKQLSALDCCG